MKVWNNGLFLFDVHTDSCSVLFVGRGGRSAPLRLQSGSLRKQPIHDASGFGH